ncbi:MAG: DNA translocase FtsK [Chlamydiia bacterium]|nr:DNA translocase FtsK [Chlamydiia bacterium]
MLDVPFLRDHVYSETALIEAMMPERYTRYNYGGVISYYFLHDLENFNLEHLLSHVGVALTFSILALVSFILFTEIQIAVVLGYVVGFFRGLLWGVKKTGHATGYVLRQTRPVVGAMRPMITRRLRLPRIPSLPNMSLKLLPTRKKEDEIEEAEIEVIEPRKPMVTIRKSKRKKSSEKKVAAEVKPTPTPRPRPGSHPPITLLTDAKTVDQPSLKKELRRQAEVLEETLSSFGIEAKVGEINCGPTITSFEVHPAIGVKVQKIKALENDIALNLQSKSIRIIAPIPGKAAVGVEVPSLYPQEVGFKEMLTSYRRGKARYHIPILLGKTVSGDEVITDLTKMPHCIIAGATGSGKSVCINTMIMSILMNCSHEDVKLILVDPKKVELTPFMSLPHLVAPVITEPAGAYAALNYLVKEMQDRYEILKQLGHRNIHAFNSRKLNLELESSLSMDVPEKMSFMVMIIDEFADLMMSTSMDLETPIARIAQMARAVGIHLILATQRPSREVITGLIKANFPTRIAFKVASRVNSQIILDENGAETLLGNGDMLFLPPGSSQLTRAQGVYLSDRDITATVDHLIRTYGTNYLLKSFDALGAGDFFPQSGGGNSGEDELYEKAKELVITSKTASTTFLQRKLKVGYARAASLVDALEENGVVGPSEGSRPRKVLL